MTHESTSPSYSRKRPRDATALHHEPATDGKRSRRHSGGHAYSDIVILDDARAHVGAYYGHVYNGDVYNVNGHVHGPLSTSVRTDAEKATELIQWLNYPRQNARRGMINSASEDTFDWIFGDDKEFLDRLDDEAFHGDEDSSTVVPLARWLRGGSGLYWITGKAGSGKSTLMKMLSEDKRTVELLAEWCGDQPVVLLSFYFWHSGTDTQRSILGLLRSLLCDILRARPDLAEVVYPGWQPKFSVEDPTVAEAMSAFRNVMEIVGTETHVCLFVDGLDEYEGGEINKDDLAKFFASVVQRPRVKAVVSSRPLRVFESSFAHLPHLAMHTLTFRDITALATTELEADVHFGRLRDENLGWADRLVHDIANRSAGVLLWAVWAVKILLEGCRHEDDIGELEDRLRLLPRELEQLFVMMLERIPPGYRKEGFRYLKIALLWHTNDRLSHQPLEAVTLALAGNPDKVSDDFWKDSVPPKYAEQQKSRLRARLHTATQGLLEEHEDVMEFMHKSVTDFFELQGNSAWIQSSANEPDDHFDPNVALTVGLAMQARVDRLTMVHSCAWPFFDVTRMAEESCGQAQTAIAERLLGYLLARVPSNNFSAYVDWYLGELLSAGCSRYFEQKLRGFGSLILPTHSILVSDAILGSGLFHGVFFQDNLTYIWLLMHYVTSPYARLEVRVWIGTSPDPEEQTILHLFPWEVALFGLCWSYSDPSFRETSCAYERYHCRDNLEYFDLLMDLSTDLTGSSIVVEETWSLFDPVPREATVSGILHRLLDVKCRFCRVYWTDNIVDPLALSSCACEGASYSRSKIHAMLQKLLWRETM